MESSLSSPVASPAATAAPVPTLIGAGPVAYYNGRTGEMYSVVVTDMLSPETALAALATTTGESFAAGSSRPIQIVEERRFTAAESETYAKELTDTGVYPDAMLMLTTKMEGEPGLAVFAAQGSLYFSVFGIGLGVDTLPFLKWTFDLIAHSGDAPVVPEGVITIDI
jgi:hypothetical protein